MNKMLATHKITLTRSEFIEILADTSYNEFHKNLQKKHPHLPEDFQKDLSVHIKDALETEIKAIEGIKELLQNLKNNNIPFSVCSNSRAENLLLKLRKTGLYDYFTPHIYSRNHIENKKPAPDIYLHAAKNRGIHPGDCLVVEDSFIGVQAGVAAGMTVIAFAGEAHRNPEEADLLLRKGAKMIALDTEQIWDHISNFVGFPPTTPAPGNNFNH